MLQVQRNNNNQTRVKAAGDTGSGGAEAGKERTQGTLCDLQITRCSDWINSTLLETCRTLQDIGVLSETAHQHHSTATGLWSSHNYIVIIIIHFI